MKNSLPALGVRRAFLTVLLCLLAPMAQAQEFFAYDASAEGLNTVFAPMLDNADATSA